MNERLADARDALDAYRRSQTAARPLDLFSTPEELDVDQAVEHAHTHTSPAWKREALDAVRAVAERRVELTVDDVDWPAGPEPLDDRARGGVMRAAARAGLIESTRTYRPSTRPKTHCRPMLVWRSMLTAQQ